MREVGWRIARSGHKLLCKRDIPQRVIEDALPTPLSGEGGPELATGRSCGRIDGRIVRDIKIEIQSATGLANDGHREVNIVVAEIDDVWPSAEGAERRSAGGGELGGGG